MSQFAQRVKKQSQLNFLKFFILLVQVHNQLTFTLSGWWYTYPSEKYESQWEGFSHILWKIKNVPNHQPVMFTSTFSTPVGLLK